MKEKVVEAIKAFDDTHKVLTRAKTGGKIRKEANMTHFTEDDALGYKLDEEDVEDTLFAGNLAGKCLFCKKPGHFKRECKDFKKKIARINEYKLASGSCLQSMRR